MPIYKSDKPDSKALFCSPRGMLTDTLQEPEMKGFTQIEGQSTQGSDK